eukprot:11177940-Lingulodinium_polyedra.AAC.1
MSRQFERKASEREHGQTSTGVGDTSAQWRVRAQSGRALSISEAKVYDDNCTTANKPFKSVSTQEEHDVSIGA